MRRPPPEMAHQGAGRLAQLLGEVIVHHAPWTASVAEHTRRAVTDQWLEGLESHTGGKLAPLLQHLTAQRSWPDELAPLMQEVAGPSAQFGATIQQFFTYGVMFSLASQLLAPVTQDVSNAIWSAH